MIPPSTFGLQQHLKLALVQVGLQNKHSLATLPLVVHIEGDGTDDDHYDEDDGGCDGGLAPGLGADDGVLADVAVLPGEVLLALALRLPGLGPTQNPPFWHLHTSGCGFGSS